MNLCHRLSWDLCFLCRQFGRSLRFHLLCPVDPWDPLSLFHQCLLWGLWDPLDQMCLLDLLFQLCLLDPLCLWGLLCPWGLLFLLCLLCL